MVEGLKPKHVDLDISITVRKEVLSYMKLRISNYVPYNWLSYSVQALVANLTGVKILKNKKH